MKLQYDSMIFYIAAYACLPFKIRLAGSERYLRGMDGVDNIVHLSDESKADTLAYLWDPETTQHAYLRVNNHLNIGYSYDMARDCLALGHSSEDIFEKFTIVSADLAKNQYWIVQNQRCLTYSENYKKFILSACFENEDNQKFEIDMGPERGLHLLENIETYEIHDSPSVKDYLHKSHVLETEKDSKHRTKDGKDIVDAIFKYLYDMSLCFVEKGTCAKNGFEAYREAKERFRRSTYSSSRSSSSSSSSSSRSSSNAKSSGQSSSKSSG